MEQITMKQMLEAGSHFGHQTKRWNPKMKKYIFGARNNIYIIDLQKSLKMFKEACTAVTEITSNGGTILFVGTKKQAQEIIKKEADRCKMFYVKQRWLGGMLTNFKTIHKSIDQLKKIELMISDGSVTALPKKEILKIHKEKERLEKFFNGIKNMTTLPSAIFIIDPRREKIALLEAKKLNIKIIAIVDTNCDPEGIDYVIPGNDDAIRSIKMITENIAEAALEGKAVFDKRKAALAEQEEKEKAEKEKIKAKNKITSEKKNNQTETAKKNTVESKKLNSPKEKTAVKKTKPANPQARKTGKELSASAKPKAEKNLSPNEKTKTPSAKDKNKND